MTRKFTRPSGAHGSEISGIIGQLAHRIIRSSEVLPWMARPGASLESPYEFDSDRLKLTPWTFDVVDKESAHRQVRSELHRRVSSVNAVTSTRHASDLIVPHPCNVAGD